MATKRINQLTQTATEADLKSGNYLALDGAEGTKRLPAEMVEFSGNSALRYANLAEVARDFEDYLQIEFSVDNFVSGNINPQGSVVDLTSTRVITSSPIRVNCTRIKLNTDGLYKHGISFYTSSVSSKSDFVLLDEWHTGTHEYAVPPQANYFRVVVATEPIAVIDKNEAVASLSGFFQVAKELKPLAFYDEFESLKNDWIDNDGTLWEQGSIDTSNASEKDADNRIRTKFIQTYGNFYVAMFDPYRAWVLLYDQDKKYIGHSDDISYTRRFDNVGYVRIRVQRADGQPLDPNSVDFRKIIIPKVYAKPFSLTNKVNEFDAENSTYADISQKWHKLYLDYSGKNGSFVRETFLCRDASNQYDINYYTFGNGSKKIAIVCGQHGPKSDPRDHVITTYRFFRDLCENNFNGGFMSALKDDYTILVIPCLNPYGYDNYNELVDDTDTTPGGRKNYNGVNLNRDWGDLSQVETSSAASVIRAFAPDVCMDVHTTGNYPVVPSEIGGAHWYLSEMPSGNLGTEFANLVKLKFIRDYNIDVIGYATHNNQGQYIYFGAHECNAASFLVEMNYYVKGVNELHSSQIESSNYSLLLNGLKYICSKKFSFSYEYERVLPQNNA